MLTVLDMGQPVTEGERKEREKRGSAYGSDIFAYALIHFTSTFELYLGRLDYLHILLSACIVVYLDTM